MESLKSDNALHTVLLLAIIVIGLSIGRIAHAETPAASAVSIEEIIVTAPAPTPMPAEPRS